MKKCPWCGREYEDGVSLCEIDQSPVESCCSAPDPPDDGSRGGRSVRHTLGGRAARPWSVVVALALLFVTSCLQFQSHASHGRGVVMDIVMLFVPLWFTFRGNSWARWFWVVYFVLNVAVSVPRLAQHLQAQAFYWVAQWCFRRLVVGLAAAALFLPSSNQWFRENKRTQPG